MMTLFQNLGATLDSAAETFVTDTVTRLIDTITPWALAGVTLYVTLTGYLIMMGMVRQPAKEGLIKGGKILLIAALALNADTYLTWVVETLTSFLDRMAVAITGQEGVTVYQTLDATLDSGFDLFGQCVTKALDAGWTEMGTMIAWFLTGLLFIVTFGLVVVIGGGAIIIAASLLKLVFAIGPFFILMLAFPATVHLFKRWIGKALTYIFQIVMVAALMAIVVRVFVHILGSIDLSAASDQNGLQVSLGVAATGVVLYLLTHETTRLAGELGGGVAVEMMSAVGLASAAVAPMRAARNAINPTSYRIDPHTGHKTPGSRLEHIASGRTVVNPVYRRGLLAQMARGWQPPPPVGGSINHRPRSS